VSMVLQAWTSLGPTVTAARMVRDYTRDLYEPAAASARHLCASKGAAAIDLAAWRERVDEAWDGVSITAVDIDAGTPRAGDSRHVEVNVDLGGLSPEDVCVQCVHGPVGHDGDFTGTEVVELARTDAGAYRGEIAIAIAGTHGISARVFPVHADLASPFDVGRMAWAE
jgi:glycogen phosphorylase